ncbi:N-acetylglucosaminyldiphosphoundecaprenol N-acetyl-beta-D-mannosaminyltransferase [Clostridiales bacterium]|nr:N-acetylglucosaminyldiphosphoundecaprenol N-acetyl-beta-D-mannosaminyltransferase [Clostridiales bacterium]
MVKSIVLEVPFDIYSLEESADLAVKLIGEKGQHIICTPNPEIVMEAQTDRELMGILKSADMVTADGIGVVWASKYSSVRIPERVSGYDLVLKIFERLRDTENGVYFLGGAPGVAQKASEIMKKKYNINVVGVHDGYFSEKEERDMIAEIKKIRPSLLLVGLGSPKQEKWIYNNLRLTGANLAIGIGGCFDVMSGNLKRAPKIFTRLGLEWLYRLIKQPTRFKRMLKLPKFVLKVSREARKAADR